MERTLSGYDLEALSGPLRAAHADLAARYPGDAGSRQPVHTVYGGAQLFRADTAQRLGKIANAAFAEYAGDAAALARATGIGDTALAQRVHERVRDKLAREAVEDFRIDFEDGYGVRPDDEEAVRAAAVGAQVRAWDEDTAPNDAPD